MIGELLGLFKAPVTTFTKRAEERNIKKEAIIAGIIAVVIAIVTVLTSYIGIVKSVNKQYPSLKKYNDTYSWRGELTKSEFKEMKKEAKSELLEDVNFVGKFFKTLAITAVAIALVAAILFIIARMLKSPRDYIEMFSMSNSAFMIYLLGFLLNTIFTYIYAPIGIVLFVGALIFAVIALANAFRENIEVEDTDKLVIYSTIVLTIVFAILVIITVNSLKSSLGGLSSMLNF